jgi:hypothetical protein
VREVMDRRKVSATQACLACHEPEGRDFLPLSFDRHCASCHEKNLQPTVGIPEEDVASGDEAELARARGRVSKTNVRHEDPWILASLRKLHRAMSPEAEAGERAALAAELSRLRRRAALATPLATLSDEDLAARARAIDLELAALERRIGAQSRASGVRDARAGEVAAALSGSPDPSVRAAARDLERSLAAEKTGASPVADFAGHRQQVLDLLDAALAAEAAPAARIDDLRRRVLALSPRDDAGDVLARALEQRRHERARVEDEQALRREGPLPPVPVVLSAGPRAVQRAVEDVEERLRRLEAVPPAGDTTAESQARRRESADSLAASCIKCHIVENAALLPVRAARTVMTRARFVHRPHLIQADCLQCHGSVEKSASARDLNFAGVASCRECHRPGAVRQECLTCHRYHAPAVP